MSGYYKIITVFLIMCVSACSPFENLRPRFEKKIPESSRAFLIGKYSVQCEPNSRNTECTQTFGSIALSYKNLEGKVRYDRFDFVYGDMLGVNTEPDEIAYQKNEKSFYFCRILPPGRYSIFDISYWNFVANRDNYMLKDDSRFDIPFQMEAGKISVIDHLKITTSKDPKKRRPFNNLPGGLEISALSAAEVSLAIQKCPENARTREVVYQNLWQKKYNSDVIKIKN